MSKCELFENIAIEVWDSIARNNHRGNALFEEGITRQTVIDKVQNYVESRQNFEVFAQKARDEANTGGDLEIYIEVGYQRFMRVFLQAKILKPGNFYEGLNSNSGSSSRKQHETLKQFAKDAKCHANYIFYNGIHGFYKNDYVDCKGQHNEKQFGCAIIEIEDVKTICSKNASSKYKMDEKHGPIGIPWRFLTCCEVEVEEGIHLYSKSEIDMDPFFENLFTHRFLNFVTDGSLPQTPRLETVNLNIHKNGWNPTARVVITKNSKMKKRNNLLEFV